MKESDEKTRYLYEIISIISHEMKQPLNAISLISQSIGRDIEKKRLKENEVQEAMKTLISQTTKMSEMIDHMRSIIKRPSVVEFVNLNLNEVIGSAIRYCLPTLDGSNVEIVKELDTNLPEFRGDPFRLEMAFRNIINNLIKILIANTNTDGNTNKILGIKTSTKNNNQLLLSIYDNVGVVTKDLAKHIFDPFFAGGEKALSSSVLDLAIAKKIITEHRGSIDLENIDKQGTCFVITLPGL
ncbi:MAG: HAMP domain-containing histidine kinase [Oligoflexia bacterium]|nr:HAMP domain-containing histidine kinase [Oligoflexia bacterium]